MANSNSALSESKPKMAGQLEEFSTWLFDVVRKSTQGNMCIAPFNVAALLAMVHAGAKGNTAKQIKEALGLGKFSEQLMNATFGHIIKSMKGDENFVLKAANLCYLENKFKIKEKYRFITKSHFEAHVERVNFDDPKTHKKINSLVEELTNKKIKDLLSKDEIGQATLMVLINAIYFKGYWVQQFDSRLTETKPFFLGSENSIVDVSMMRLTNTFRTGKIDSIDAQFVELPCKGRNFSMIIILPNQIDGLRKVEENLNTYVLYEMKKNATEKFLCVQLPKFKIETKLEKELMSALSEWGIIDLFTSEADLSGVTDSTGLIASSIIQKCSIEIYGKGPEAAAAPVRHGVFAHPPVFSPPSVEPSFNVDHPAIFIVKDVYTNLILFMGRLANPAEK